MFSSSLESLKLHSLSSKNRFNMCNFMDSKHASLMKFACVIFLKPQNYNFSYQKNPTLLRSGKGEINKKKLFSTLHRQLSSNAGHSTNSHFRSPFCFCLHCSSMHSWERRSTEDWEIYFPSFDLMCGDGGAKGKSEESIKGMNRAEI